MKPGRNDPCPCGSGKKFKKCCQAKFEANLAPAKSAAKPIMPTPSEVSQVIELFNARHYDELEIQARLLIERYPDSGFAWKVLGTSLWMQGKEALNALQKATELLPNDAEAHNNLGLVFKRLGQFDNAVASYRRAVEINPSFSEAHSNLGGTLIELGKLDEAVASYRHTLKIMPNHAEAHCNLGAVLLDLGQIDEAAACFYRALEIKSDYADAHYNLGAALRQLGQLSDAALSYQRALALKPDYLDAHYNLGYVLIELGRLEDAVTSYQNALLLKPDYADAHYNLGAALRKLGRLNEAVACYRRTLEIQSDYVEAHYNLSVVLRELGQLDEAIICCRRTLEIKPDFIEAYGNLGVILIEQGRTDEAVTNYRQVLKIKPDFAKAHCNLGVALRDQGLLDEAILSYQRSLAIEPNFAETLCNLGVAQRDLGQFDEAITSYKRALEIKHDHVGAHNNLLFILNFVANRSPLYCIEQARQFGRIMAEQVESRFSSWQCETQPKRLKVGLVSGDLLSHPVGYFLEGILAHIDPARIELIAYSTRYKEDDLTARIQPYFSAWNSLIGLSDHAAAQKIHADGVHILIDISGHTNLNRLPLFAWKPAPVQATWLGYFATTGIAEIDYLLANEVGVPKDQQANFTESIWYLPDTRLCFTPPKFEVPVTPLPALSSNNVTFGCFQNLAKVGDDVLAVWGKIFASLPNARLRMQSNQFNERSRKEEMLQRLQHVGIAFTQVDMQGSTSYSDYLAAHANVDFILDTFPYPGGTTTCEALWMGVPTLTLAGDRLLARQGASLLTAAGLTEWVASSQEDYINKALAFANDLPKLEVLRAGLRQQVLNSPVFDVLRFARNFEEALWGMWRKYEQSI